MNRIRKYKDVFQVLITPHNRFDSGFELMLGNWSDDHLQNYSIKNFQDKDDAFEEAFNYPPIDWEKMVLFHKDIYVKLHKIIRQDIEASNFIVELEPKILTGDQLKDIMFDRVMIYGKRFRLDYNLNDIFGYHIINPWSKNLIEIKKKLESNANLRIVRTETSSGVIRLIGETDIGTNYEIVLWPTLIAHWARWVSKNPNLVDSVKKTSLKDMLESQLQIEKNASLR